MSNFNFTDLYICYDGHPRFNSSELIEDDIARVIVQKYEMIIFTDKGDLFGDLDFGAGLVELLHETRYSGETIAADITSQINTYIPELNGVSYTLDVNFFEDPERYQEYMVVDFTFYNYEVNITVT